MYGALNLLLASCAVSCLWSNSPVVQCGQDLRQRLLDERRRNLLQYSGDIVSQAALGNRIQDAADHFGHRELGQGGDRQNRYGHSA